MPQSLYSLFLRICSLITFILDLKACNCLMVISQRLDFSDIDILWHSQPLYFPIKVFQNEWRFDIDTTFIMLKYRFRIVLNLYINITNIFSEIETWLTTLPGDLFIDILPKSFFTSIMRYALHNSYIIISIL